MKEIKTNSGWTDRQKEGLKLEFNIPPYFERWGIIIELPLSCDQQKFVILKNEKYEHLKIM